MFQDPTIGALVFFVQDVRRTMQFYGETLGLEVQEAEGHDGNFATAQVGSTVLVFLPGKESPGSSPVVVFGIEGGIDDLAEQLAGRGVEIVVPVSEAPDGGLTLDFVDPDRHTLSLHQPAGAPRRR